MGVLESSCVVRTLYYVLMCCVSVVGQCLFDMLLTMWDTFGKFLGAAGGLGKVVGTP